MSKLIYVEKLTNETLGDYEQTMERLKNQPIRQKAFERFTEYYNTHGWFGGYCGDLHVINLTCMGSELHVQKVKRGELNA